MEFDPSAYLDAPIEKPLERRLHGIDLRLELGLCLLAGGLWGGGSSAGVWAVNWGAARTGSADYVGFRAASYL